MRDDLLILSCSRQTEPHRHCNSNKHMSTKQTNKQTNKHPESKRSKYITADKSVTMSIRNIYFEEKKIFT